MKAATPPAPNSTRFAVTADTVEKHEISGEAAPNSIVEIINMTTAPAQMRRVTDTVRLAQADSSGHFSGVLPACEAGDKIKLRFRSGKQTSSWLSTRLNPQFDTRPATINLRRMEAFPAPNVDGEGKVSLKQPHANPLGESDANIRFINLRTGDRVDTKLDGDGILEENLLISGRSGDTITVSISDGVHNKGLSEIAGKLKVHSPAHKAQGPQPLRTYIDAKGEINFSEELIAGSLFGPEGPKPSDIIQGAVGDCYLASALSSIVSSSPDELRNIIQEDKGKFFVRVFPDDEDDFDEDVIEFDVDAVLPVHSNGVPLYGQGSQSKDGMNLWFPLIEKAVASWDGGYDGIDGGNPAAAYWRLLGAPSWQFEMKNGDENSVYDHLEAMSKAGSPSTAGTYGDSERYVNMDFGTGHAYAVHGVEEIAGKKYVKLHNPWGRREPILSEPQDGIDDGFFKNPLSDFVEQFDTLTTAQWSPAKAA